MIWDTIARSSSLKSETASNGLLPVARPSCARHIPSRRRLISEPTLPIVMRSQPTAFTRLCGQPPSIHGVHWSDGGHVGVTFSMLSRMAARHGSNLRVAAFFSSRGWIKSQGNFNFFLTGHRSLAPCPLH